MREIRRQQGLARARAPVNDGRGASLEAAVKDVEQAFARYTRALSRKRDLIEDEAHDSIPLTPAEPARYLGSTYSTVFLRLGWLRRSSETMVRGRALGGTSPKA